MSFQISLVRHRNCFQFQPVQMLLENVTLSRLLVKHLRLRYLSSNHLSALADQVSDYYQERFYIVRLLQIYIYFTKIKNSTSPTSSQLIGEVVSWTQNKGFHSHLLFIFPTYPSAQSSFRCTPVGGCALLQHPQWQRPFDDSVMSLSVSFSEQTD